jgi:hypothetical protein
VDDKWSKISCNDVKDNATRKLKQIKGQIVVANKLYCSKYLEQPIQPGKIEKTFQIILEGLPEDCCGFL